MNKKTLFKNIRYLMYILIVLVLLFIIFKWNKELRRFDINQIKTLILSYGNYSALCYVIIYSIKPMLVFAPSSLLSVLAANIFGPFQGFILSMLSSFIAATFAFFLTRSLGKPFVDKLLKGKALKLDDKIEKNGFIIILLMRLSFVFPFDGLSFACGITKMKYKDFIFGTMIGIIPEMLAYSFLGNNIKTIFSVKCILPICGLITIAIISYFAYKKYTESVEES